MSSAPRSLSPGDFLKAWLLLLVEGGATHGYELRRELEAHGVRVNHSAIYRVLRRLEHECCVASAWARPAAGPRRRSYRLSPAGRQRLDETAGQIAVARDLHAAFLRAHEQAVRQRARSAAVGAGCGPPTGRGAGRTTTHLGGRDVARCADCGGQEHEGPC